MCFELWSLRSSPSFMYRSTLYFSAGQRWLLLKLNGVNYWLMCNLIADVRERLLRDNGFTHSLHMSQLLLMEID